MKLFSWSAAVIAIAMILIGLSFIPPVWSQNADSLDIVEAVICREVADHKPVDPGTDFLSTVGKLFCFTKVRGAKTETHITHVWYYGNTERFRIILPVKSASWRTYSIKNIRPNETGAWHVDILDSAGNRLEVLNFLIEKR
jgi:hypothetical protein